MSAKTKKPNKQDLLLEKVTIPKHLKQSKEFMDCYKEWLSDRSERHKQVTERAVQLQMNKLKNLSSTGAIKCIMLSIERGYLGLFPDEFEIRYPYDGEDLDKDSDEWFEYLDSRYGPPGSPLRVRYEKKQAANQS